MCKPQNTLLLYINFFQGDCRRLLIFSSLWFKIENITLFISFRQYAEYVNTQMKETEGIVAGKEVRGLPDTIGETVVSYNNISEAWVHMPASLFIY